MSNTINNFKIFNALFTGIKKVKQVIKKKAKGGSYLNALSFLSKAFWTVLILWIGPKRFGLECEGKIQ